ncbi:hypothetical protein V2H45_10320 [Tumidithrix elongata RA019]|uniref:Uncharacterized protein n=1 Tax=Tumidithrix elongata BACA0141 TaxID=2716417 RepID=A0AAW9PS92_9CYAN|nr:hypothetical protein [Tumidithrix elongata RA019]
MATYNVVKDYLAQWMQVGKKVWLQSENRAVGIRKVIEGEKYAQEFESLWSEISTTKANEAYLEGTEETIQDLLSNKWELVECARCSLPVACLDMGAREISACPCSTMRLWPNLETIPPRKPVKTTRYLNNICDRLLEKRSPAST